MKRRIISMFSLSKEIKKGETSFNYIILKLYLKTNCNSIQF